jgi:16S rRNA processing protein RimM
MSLEDWNWTIGEIVAPFSRFGEVKVRLETDFPDRFSRLSQVCLRRSPDEARLYGVKGVRFHKGQALLKLEGIDSISEADTLRNALVQVRAEDAVALPKNEFYIHDLLGCEVVTREGRVLGVLTAVLRAGAHDIYVIGSGKSEILLPVIKEVVREIDLPERRITVTPTPGLLPGESEEIRE